MRVCEGVRACPHAIGSPSGMSRQHGDLGPGLLDELLQVDLPQLFGELLQLLLLLLWHKKNNHENNNNTGEKNNEEEKKKKLCIININNTDAVYFYCAFGSTAAELQVGLLHNNQGAESKKKSHQPPAPSLDLFSAR